MAKLPTSAPNVGTAKRLAARPFAKLGGGKKARFVLDDGSPANVRPLTDDNSTWLWEDGVVTDVAGNPIVGPVRDESGAIVGYMDRDGKTVVKEAYDMLVGGDSPAADMPDAVDASDPAALDIAIPDVVDGEVVIAAPEDPNVAASAPDVEPRAKQVDRIKRLVNQIGGDLQNPNLDYPVSQDDINALATQIGELTPDEIAALSADSVLRERMDLVRSRSNNQPRAEVEPPGDDATRRSKEFLDRENAPAPPRRGGAMLAERAKALGLEQKDIPEVLRARAPEDRSLATRANSENEANPGAMDVDEQGQPKQIINNDRLARDTPAARVRKLLETAQGFKPGFRDTRLRVAMDPAERVAAGELAAGSPSGVIESPSDVQGSGKKAFFRDTDMISEGQAERLVEVRDQIEQLHAETMQQIAALNAPAQRTPQQTAMQMAELRRLEAAARHYARVYVRVTDDLARIGDDGGLSGMTARGVSASDMPDSTEVVDPSTDLANFPSRRRDSSGGRISQSRRDGATQDLLSVPRRGPSGKTVRIVVPGLVGQGKLAYDPLEFALIAAERAGMNIDGPMPQSLLDEIVNQYNRVFGDYAPIRGRVLADSPEIAGFLPAPQRGELAVRPDRGAELALTPEQRNRFNELLAASRPNVFIDDPDGFGSVVFNPESGSWEIEASDFVVGEDGVATPTGGNRVIDSEALAGQAGQEASPRRLTRSGLPKLIEDKNAAVSGETASPPPEIPAGTAGKTPDAVPQFSDMEIDDELERHYRDVFNNTHPEGTEAFPDFESWWQSAGAEVTRNASERRAAASRMAGSAADIPPVSGDDIPGSAAKPKRGGRPKKGVADPAPASGKSGDEVSDAEFDFPDTSPDFDPLDPAGRTKRKQPADGGGGPPPDKPPRDPRLQSAFNAAALGTTAAALAYFNRKRQTVAQLAEELQGMNPGGIAGGGGGVPPGLVSTGGSGGMSDPLANDRAFQMARALQLIQAARVPQYQTANNPIGYTYRN
jgi:hypothetical protein